MEVETVIEKCCSFTTCNRNVGFDIKIEIQDQEETPQEIPLNSREKYARLIEAYPLIKELRDKLKLELDY